MAKKTRTRKSRITEEQISEMLRLRRLGKSISEIARITGFHRQTITTYLKERQADVLADEVRKQLLTNELQKHLDSLIQFAASLMEHLTLPDSPTEERDAASVLGPLLPKELPEVLDPTSWKSRREQQQTDRQNKMLLESLREHTSETEWWRAFEEWQENWNMCRSVLEELRKEANDVIRKIINENPSFKGEVDIQTEEDKEHIIKNVVNDVLWLAWKAVTGEPYEEIVYLTKEGMVAARFSDGTHYPMGHKISDDSLWQDIAEVYQSGYETLCHSFTKKNVVEMLYSMNEKIEIIDNILDPFVLRPSLVRTRCGLCPV